MSNSNYTVTPARPSSLSAWLHCIMTKHSDIQNSMQCMLGAALPQIVSSIFDINQLIFISALFEYVYTLCRFFWIPIWLILFLARHYEYWQLNAPFSKKIKIKIFILFFETIIHKRKALSSPYFQSFKVETEWTKRSLSKHTQWSALKPFNPSFISCHSVLCSNWKTGTGARGHATKCILLLFFSSEKCLEGGTVTLQPDNSFWCRIQIPLSN